MPDTRETKMDFLDAYALQDLAPGSSRPLRLRGTDVLLCNVGGNVHAIENECLHHGAALNGGKLCGNVVTCPAHGWRYDVTTGALLIAPDKRLRTFPVEVADGRILVQLPDATPNATHA